jgi:RecA/RadA recombinase
MAAKKTTNKTAAKKAAKKAPAKKAPAKKAAKKAPAKKAAQQVRLDDPDKLKPMVFKKKFGDNQKSKVFGKMAENVRKSVDVLSERSKTRPVKLLTPAMLRRTLVPYDDLMFQHMLSSIGFRTPVAIEVVAAEHVGSTTWAFDFISRLLDMGCYAIYCECEGKQMDDKRIKRLMDRDPKVAMIKLNSIVFTESRTLAQFDETLRKTVEDVRKRCDSDPETKGNPIFFIADPWGAQMAEGEAKGNSDWGMPANAKKEAPKDSAAGSNFEHAKHAQRMTRWLPAFMEKNNCTVIFLNKQNDKVDMGQKRGPAAFLTPSPSSNDTRIGGRALKRLCAYRMTIVRLDDIRSKVGDKKVYGHNSRIKLIKNSYGPRDRHCDFTVFFDDHKDTKEHLSPGITYADRTAAWMVKNKFLGTTVEKDLYTCDALNCVAVPAADLYEALRNHPEHVEFLGSQLGIEGYAGEVRHIEPTEDSESEDDEEEDIPDLVPEDDDDTPDDTVPSDDEEETPELVP